ncbi:MAG: TRAP transporter fused permease subunit [Tissierellia bacterium]|nr:TRAP transporter fused permease subunit [Tissierellia bacterium]
MIYYVKEGENILEENRLSILQFFVFLFGLSIILLNFFTILETIAFRAYFAMGIGFLALVLNKNKNEKIYYFSILLSIMTIVAFIYIIYRYPQIISDGGILKNIDYLMGLLALILIFILGYFYSKNLLILVFLFTAYALWGKFAPIFLSHSGFSINRIISHMIWGSQGIFGVTIGVCASYIFLFLIFGEFLQKSGLSGFINDISLALIGEKQGGPAKVAIIASALLGMINGSAVANVATTGMITIPLMKRIGYREEFAAAVEATASTGGQFCPPIMGAVGFVMAEYLGIPYTKVMVAAIIPAIYYYFGVLVSVHQEAKAKGLHGLPKEELPNLYEVLKTRGFLSIPIIVVVLLIIMRYSPIYASIIGMITTVIISQFTKENKMGPREIMEAIVKGTLSSISIGVSCLLIGIVIGIVSLTALGLNFGNLIMSSPAINNTLTAGILTMVMSIILGMGVPGVAAYVIVVSVSVPILIQMGSIPLVAHMFCLIYACLSNITPPVAISSYVAAGIAGADEFKTSIEALKIGITGFIFPFFFLMNPELLIGATSNVNILYLLRIFFTGLFGVFNIACAFEGMLINKLNKLERILLFGVGLLAVDPGFITDIFGFGIFLIILMINRRRTIEEYI